jgi:HEPN domain-containing protein
MKSRAGDWLKQAEEEQSWANDALAHKRWALVCFTAQQIAEKCLKAIAIHRGAAQVKSHSTLEIILALRIDGELEEAARILDLYYISTRYPDAFSTGAPFEYFTERQAREALGFAVLFIERAKADIHVDG